MGENLDHTPTLFFTQWARFLDSHGITRTALIWLIVSLKAPGNTHGVLVETMFSQGLYGNNDRLIHLVADDSTNLLLPPTGWRRHSDRLC
jgi:hypothetical protein